MSNQLIEPCPWGHEMMEEEDGAFIHKYPIRERDCPAALIRIRPRYLPVWNHRPVRDAARTEAHLEMVKAMNDAGVDPVKKLLAINNLLKGGEVGDSDMICDRSGIKVEVDNPPFDPVEFGKAVRERRLQRSPSSAFSEVCNEVGTVLRILREVEDGQIESIETFAKFCRWMETSADAWLHLDEFEED